MDIYGFIRSLRNEGFTCIYAASRIVAGNTGCKHARSGRIESRCPVKDARGVQIAAYGYDELGNVTALCADGIVRQYC